MSTMLWILAIAIVVFVAVAPLGVRSGVRYSSRPEVAWVRSDDLPGDVLERLREGSDAWGALGFEPVADLVVTGMMTNVVAYRRLLTDPHRTTVALVRVDVDARRPGVREGMLGLGSRLSRGTTDDGYTWDEIATTDVNQPLPNLPNGNVTTLVPGATASQLLAVHRAVLAGHPGDEMLQLADPVEAVTEDVERAFAAQVEAGILQDRGDGDLRMTVSGAYRLVLPNLPGALQVGRWRRRRRAERILVAIES